MKMLCAKDTANNSFHADVHKALSPIHSLKMSLFSRAYTALSVAAAAFRCRVLLHIFLWCMEVMSSTVLVWYLGDSVLALVGEEPQEKIR